MDPDKKGIKTLLHYLHDFVFVSKSGEVAVAAAYKQSLLDTFAHLGVSLEPQSEEPATCLTFLGIEVDSRTSQLCLPSDKLHRLKDQLAAAVSKRFLT